MSVPPLELVSAVPSTQPALPLPSAVPPPDPGDHFVQLYESDGFLIECLAAYVREGLERDETVIVIATARHHEDLAARLAAAAVDLDAATAAGRYQALDAAVTLAEFMVDGMPDGGRFAEVIGGRLQRVAEAGRPARLFGEMVGLLLESGNLAGTVRLEALWEDLRARSPFRLYCAYPLASFTGAARSGTLDEVCGLHARVVPAESYTQQGSDERRARVVSALQQRAASLEEEIAVRRRVELALRAAKVELGLQVLDLQRLHEMSGRLAGSLGVESVLREVLDASLVVHGASMGLLSLRDADDPGGALLVHRGVPDEMARALAGVPPVAAERVVIEDVDQDPRFAAHRDVARAAGFRACHSTPLRRRDGRVVAVITVHFPRPYAPTDRQVRLMDLYARIAAAAIESARLHERLQRELEERRESLAREYAARAEAERANRMKDEFLATVSHELRTPLNAIVGWAHVLGRGTMDPGVLARGVEVIARNARTQARLVDDILDASHVITGTLRLNAGPVDMAGVINAAIDVVRLAADAKEIRLEVVLDPAARRVIGDAARLQQVMWNLLSNAIKFTPAGGEVRVRLARGDDAAMITVTDTGEGIEAALLPFIFDRFRQGDSTMTRRHGGLGLGLAIVRHLVEMHGGEVTAESAGPGRGATFVLRIPLDQAGEQEARRMAAGSRPWTGAAAALPAPSAVLRDVKLLVVDDDRESLDMVVMILREAGATVRAAASAAEGAELLRREWPDVLISDLAMPGEDGHALIRDVRAQETGTGPWTPAVALTARVRQEDRARALAAGYTLFLAKPVDPAELIATLRTLARSGSA